jgi:hypothetical protein
VRTLPAEQREEWKVGHRYYSAESLTGLAKEAALLALAADYPPGTAVPGGEDHATDLHT